jgi:hypothetical protein
METEPRKGRLSDYIEETLFPDALIGLLAWVVIAPVALLLGGFMFIEPWCIVTPAAMLAFGMLRGGTDGNGWIKGLGMNLGILLFLVVRMVWGPTQLAELNTLLLAALVTVIPTVVGLAFRRRLLIREKRQSGQG